MSLLDELSSKEMTPQETAEILHRIVRAVEKSERHRWMEITSAVVLSLATVASAWCAYEATRWSSVQTFRLATANTAARDAAAANFAGMQTLAFDASMLISYLEARSRGDAQLEKILHDRFRPEAKKAIEAWLKTDPFNNPAAPSNPFKMAEYVQPELEEARRQGDLSTMNNTAAQQASTTSDNYVLLTVLFASVLFFGGIGGTFDSRRLRIGVLSAALLLLAITLVAMGTMPVCRE